MRAVLLLYAAVLSALSIASCAGASGFVPFGGQTIALVLPDAPPSWSCLTDLEFLVTWRGRDGAPRSASAAPNERFPIEVDRGCSQAILAVPSSGGRQLMPAGALFPLDLEPAIGSCEGELRLGWASGYVATVASRLEAAGLRFDRFDLSRLGSEIAENEKDPWELPTEEAARRLAAGTFRASLLESPRRSMALPWPGPWAPESPLASAPRESGRGWTAEVAPLVVRFLAPDGRALAVDGESGLSVILEGRKARDRGAAAPTGAGGG